jgi:hypothetical protein
MKLHPPLKLALGAIALAAALSAQAKVTSMDPGDYNSNPAYLDNGGSLLFTAVSTGATPASLVVDLGYFLSDFASGPNDRSTAPSASANFNNLFGADNNTVVWNFNTNLLTVNGVAQTVTNNWSAPFAQFQSNLAGATANWGVIAGSIGDFPNYYLTTGSPTAGELQTQLNSPQSTNSLANVAVITNFSNNPVGSALNTLNQAGNGAVSVANTTTSVSGYVGSNIIMGTPGKWKGNLAWSTFTAGDASGIGLYQLNDLDGGINKLAGTLSYNAGVLTWQTPLTQAPQVPEPSGYLLVLAGFSVLGFVGRRRLGS